jgi:serpin B
MYSLIGSSAAFAALCGYALGAPLTPLARTRNVAPVKPVSKHAAPQKTDSNAPSDPLNSFGFRMLQELNSSEAMSNIFISPASAHLAFAMAGEGAKNKTRAQIETALGLFGVGSNPLEKETPLINSLMSATDRTGGLAVANSLWTRNDFSLDPNFQSVCISKFNSSIQKVDFSSKDTVSMINNWADVHTHYHIPQIVNKIDPSTSVLLLNAVYFRSRWQNQFERLATQDHIFVVKPGEYPKVKMMTVQGTFPFYETPQYQSVALPFEGGKFRAIVVEPKDGTELGDLLSQINTQKWNDMRAHLQNTLAEVDMPHIRLDDSIPLESLLKKMGVHDAFEPQSADFSAMSSTGKNIYISDAIQKTYLEVDETGAEASAVTGIIMRPTMRGRQNGVEHTIVVQRPFLFAIEETNSGNLLFLGSIYRPGKLDIDKFSDQPAVSPSLPTNTAPKQQSGSTGNSSVPIQGKKYEVIQ